MEQYSYHTLGNGLRIVHARHMAGCGEYCGVVTGLEAVMSPRRITALPIS